MAGSSGGQVGDYDAADFAAYFIALMLVNHLTFTWIIWEFEWRIRQGMLSPILLRPIHPIHKDIADNVTYKLLTCRSSCWRRPAWRLAFEPAFAATSRGRWPPSCRRWRWPSPCAS